MNDETCISFATNYLCILFTFLLDIEILHIIIKIIPFLEINIKTFLSLTCLLSSLMLFYLLWFFPLIVLVLLVMQTFPITQFLPNFCFTTYYVSLHYT